MLSIRNSRSIALIGTAIIAFSAPAYTDNAIPGAPAWSTPARGDTASVHPDNSLKTLPGSEQSYTQEQIDDKFSAPVWFPDQHAPMPDIVQFGKKPKVWACTSCHLSSGMGHPESSTLAGLSASYIEQAMAAFASGERTDYSGHMNRMAPLLSTEETSAIANWFAGLSPQRTQKVAESKTVPSTWIDDTRMRQLDATTTELEPIGNRIVEVPADMEQVHKRDPWGEFTVYVPPGSLARGKTLVETGGGKTMPCGSCHGTYLRGGALGPSLTGNFGSYTVRQMHGFKSGSRKGAQSALMTPVVAKLNDTDIVDIAAWLASLPPAKP